MIFIGRVLGDTDHSYWWERPCVSGCGLFGVGVDQLGRRFDILVEAVAFWVMGYGGGCRGLVRGWSGKVIGSPGFGLICIGEGLILAGLLLCDVEVGWGDYGKRKAGRRLLSYALVSAVTKCLTFQFPLAFRCSWVQEVVGRVGWLSMQ